MRWLAIFLGFVLNIMLFAGAHEMAQLQSWQTLALLSVLNFIAILFHELGHASAFRWIGGGVEKIVVLFAAFDVRRRRLLWSDTGGSGDVGGYVAGTYGPAGTTRGNLIRVYGAGPLANAVTGVIALVAAQLMAAPSVETAAPARAVEMVMPDTPESRAYRQRYPTPAYLPSDAELAAFARQYAAAENARERSTMTYAALMLFAVLSFGYAVLNLIPFRGSDGYGILYALRMPNVGSGR
jgi:hypothetical protein